MRITQGGGARRVVVASVRRGGLADKAGIKSGDLLVSINGKKDFAGLSASKILQRMRGAVTLVFLGFIGKWHAEVRLNTKESPCGLQSEMPIALGRPDAPLQVYEEIVFQPTTAPLLLAVPPEPGSCRPKLTLPQGDMGEVDEVDDSKDVASDATPEDVMDPALDADSCQVSIGSDEEPIDFLSAASLATPRTLQEQAEGTNWLVAGWERFCGAKQHL
ncbi:GIP [Symbiodinium sp. KB8]|nr:GIP [Symbiodinium sp. KB8]